MKVLIIESERGWGQKIDEVKEFATREEAEKFCREYNDKHNPPMNRAPDWYMYARMEDHERGESMLRSNAGGNATERSEGRVDHNVGRQTEE